MNVSPNYLEDAMIFRILMLGLLLTAQACSHLPKEKKSNAQISGVSSPSRHSCQAYLDLEAKMECKEKLKDDCSHRNDVLADPEEVRNCDWRQDDGSNYLVSYGNYYCERFRRLETYSTDLESFVLEGRECLQRELIRHLETPGALDDCKEMEEVAYKTHPECYHEAGYCELSKKERCKITRTVVGIKFLFNLFKSVSQFVSIKKLCARDEDHSREEESIYELEEHLGSYLPNSDEVDRRVLADIFLEGPSGEEEWDRYAEEIKQTLPVKNKGMALTGGTQVDIKDVTKEIYSIIKSYSRR